MPASHYIHPEFGFFCPTPRFRRRLRVALACLVVAGIGAAVMGTADRPKLTAAVTRANEASIAETTPATSLAPFDAVVPRLPIVAGADHRGQAVLRRLHPDRGQLRFRQATQAAHGLGGE